MLPFVRIGPFLLQTPGLALLGGIWVGSWLVEKEAARFKLDPAVIYNLIFVGLISGILGARLAYAARFFEIYWSNPLSLLALNTGTLSPTEGATIGLIAAVIYGQRKGLPLRPTLDVLAPGLSAFLVFVALAHLLSGDAFGAPARLPWSVYLWDEYRHPSQVYELLAAVGIFLASRKIALNRGGSGLNFLLVVALSALAQIFLEAFRGDSVIWAGGLRAAQVIGIVILAISLLLFNAWVYSENEFGIKRELDPQTKGGETKWRTR